MMDSLALLPLLELDVHEYRLHGASISQTSILSIKKFPLSFAREVFTGLKMPERELYDYAIRSEEEEPLLHALRVLLTICGWVKKRNGRFSLTENGRKIVKEDFSSAHFWNLLDKFTLMFNWEFMDRYPPFPIIQQSFLFGLYLLHRQAGREIEDQVLAGHFLRAFPQALERPADMRHLISNRMILFRSVSPCAFWKDSASILVL